MTTLASLIDQILKRTSFWLKYWVSVILDKLWTVAPAMKTLGMSTESNDVQMALLKRQDQGSHECEVWTDGAEGAYHWKGCTKNPGHARFIPAPQFSLDHLPSEYQDRELFECIRYFSELTVKIVVKYTSTDRPNDFPFSNFRGKSIAHTGSGCVRNAGVPYEREVLKKPCPCPKCSQSSEPEKMWWSCRVITAKNVVFNEEEAQNTVIEAFFEDEQRRSKVCLLYGFEIVEDSTEGDRCEFRCATHDRFAADRLSYAVDISLSSHRKLSRDCYPTLGKEKANLCIVVSHPHGCSKYITIGNWKNCLRQGEERVDAEFGPLTYETYQAYTYDTPTCPGSSGGTVLILGMWDPRWSYILAAYYFCHTHKCREIVDGKNENESSYWLVAAEGFSEIN